jgi:hypothetical protein
MKKDHIHKLRRHQYKTGTSVFFCADDCTFKIGVELALGKKSICWRCGNPFTMTPYSLRLAKPHCENCHKSKGNKNVPGIKLPEDYTGPDRREVPTRRELDPTVLPQVAEQTISSLKERLSSSPIQYRELPSEFTPIDDEDDDEDIL